MTKVLIIDTRIGSCLKRLAVEVSPEDLEDIKIVLVRGGATIIKETELQEAK